MMDIFEVQEVDGEPHIFKDFRDDEEGLIIFGKDPDHITPMKVINEFLGKEVLRLCGSSLMVHLFLPERHMQLWSDKIGERKDLHTGGEGMGFRLDVMREAIEARG